MNFKYVFFGSYEIAPYVLEELLDTGLIPVALVCNPDKPSGRQGILTPPPTKQLLIKRGLENKVRILQPERLDEEFQKALKELQADIFIVAAYSKIIPQRVLDLAPKGVLGMHPSLLPKYRGPSPIKSVLLAHEKKTGAAVYLLDDKMDHGPIIAMEEYALSSDETHNEFLEHIARLGGKLLAKVLPEFAEGRAELRPQDDSQATYTKKFSAEDGFITEEDLRQALSGNNPDLARMIHSKIRAFTPEPGAWTLRSGKRIKLLASTLSPEGKLQLSQIQLEGKTPLDPQRSGFSF